MKSIELKSELHDIIDEINDPDLLSTIKSFFYQIKSKEIDWWDFTSENEKKLINKGLNQLENNEGISHFEVRDKVNLLFKNNA